MAGIGFRIEKILSGDTYIDVLKAHFYSTIIFSGPWLLSILTIFALSHFTPDNISIEELTFFRTSTVYIFAFSLIVVGIFHLSLTRYLSDRLYMKEDDALVPAFNASMLSMFLLQLMIGCAAMHFLDIAFVLKYFIILLYLTITAIWVIMLFLTALRDYQSITRAFLVGSLTSVVGSLFLGNFFGLRGYFLGYLIGHLIIVAMLSIRIFLEFPSKRIFDKEIFNFLLNNKTLVCIGIFYNLAIWIDKFVFWFSPKAVAIKGFLYAYPHYDSAAFLAYLTIIPALSIFLITMETNFYKKYKNYYSQILNKGTFSEIITAKEIMLKSLKESMAFVIIFQGIISLMAITFASQISSVVKLQIIQIPTFRILVFGAYLHSLVLIMIIIILYFDFKRVALAVTTVFLVINGVATHITTYLSLPFIGYGYIIGALLALIVAFYLLDHKLNRLEFITFASQPIGIHREEEII